MRHAKTICTLSALTLLGLMLSAIVSAMAASNSVPQTGAVDATTRLTLQNIAPGQCGPTTAAGLQGLYVNTSGGNGNDLVLGSTGANILNGGNGNDCIFGGGGANAIHGGGGTDTCYGDSVAVSCESLNGAPPSP